MSSAPVQTVGNASGSVTLTVTAGSTLIAFATVAGTVSDNQSNAWSAALDSYTDNTGTTFRSYKAENCAAGSTTVTATGASNIIVVEFSGVATSSGVDGHIGQHQNGATTATDNVTTGTAGTSTNAKAIVAFGFDSELYNAAPAAGSGFTSLGTFIGGAARIEWKAVSGTGAVAATFTAAHSGEATSLEVILLDFGGPTITSQPSAQQVATGSTASFSVSATASGGGTLSYQWKLNGTNVSTGSGGTTASYTTGTLGYSDDGGLYSCTVTETGGSAPGSATSTSAALSVGTRVVGTSTPVYSTSGGSSVAPSYSTLPAIAAGDEIVLVVAQKPSTANGGTVTTPSGYSLQGSLTGAGGYSTTLGNNTGNTNLFVYTKTATGSESGALTVTVGANGVCSAFFVLLRPLSGSTIAYAFASGSDTSAGNVSITCGSDPGETAGDVLLQVFNGSSNAILPFSAQALTTTGVAYGTVTELIEYGTTVGNDVAGYVAAAKAVSGTSSAAPVFTATVGGTNTNARGPGSVLRARAATSGNTSIAAGAQSGLAGAASALETDPSTAAGAQSGLAGAASALETIPGTGAGVQAGLAGSASALETDRVTVAGAQAGLAGASSATETIPGTGAGLQPGLTATANSLETDPATAAGAQSGLSAAASANTAGVNTAAGAQAGLVAAAASKETIPGNGAGAQSGLTGALAALETDPAHAVGAQLGLVASANMGGAVSGSAAGAQPGLAAHLSALESVPGAATGAQAGLAGSSSALVTLASVVLAALSGLGADASCVVAAAVGAVVAGAQSGLAAAALLSQPEQERAPSDWFYVRSDRFIAFVRTRRLAAVRADRR